MVEVVWRVFVCSMMANGLISTHLIPHVIDIGIPKVSAAATMGVMGGISFIGTIGAGWVVVQRLHTTSTITHNIRCRIRV